MAQLPVNGTTNIKNYKKQVHLINPIKIKTYNYTVDYNQSFCNFGKEILSVSVHEKYVYKYILIVII